MAKELKYAKDARDLMVEGVNQLLRLLLVLKVEMLCWRNPLDRQ